MLATYDQMKFVAQQSIGPVLKLARDICEPSNASPIGCQVVLGAVGYVDGLRRLT